MKKLKRPDLRAFFFHNPYNISLPESSKQVWIPHLPMAS